MKNTALSLFRIPATVGEFRWKTMEGRVMTLAEMRTGHIFNSMKMVFNHLAEKYVDYARHATDSPDHLGWLVVFFMEEIDRRGDLPTHMLAPYREIRNQILGIGILAEQGAAIGLLREATDNA